MHMEDKHIYITIDHLDDFSSVSFLRPGDRLILKKDKNNLYDDEAVVVYKENDTKIGYVANSVPTVARGTYSAGRLYDRMGDETECLVRFVLAEERYAIAEIE